MSNTPSDTLYQQLVEADDRYVWHPYASALNRPEVHPVVRANGVRLTLADNRELIDGMASWWCAIHGYNHPALNRAAEEQLKNMSHVMFGGLTHPPAVQLAKTLCDLTPAPLERVFLCDSGSVSVEVALKMAIQYWQAQGHSHKTRFVALRSGYHGDTFGAMGVCDPVTGMHHLFGKALPTQHFAPAPDCPFGQPCGDEDIAPMRAILEQHHRKIAAVIVEPVVQGAGGMRFYSADYLVKLRALCDQHQVLLIFDEIATGFGRTGKMFALEHAGVTPDILCLGKALTGGYMTLAATLCSQATAEVISSGEAGAFMHGPTFMGNPLACAVANASIALLLDSDWQSKVDTIEQALKTGLEPARESKQVADVRCLGAIGVIELAAPIDMKSMTRALIERGVWLRPFGKLLYCMPPYVMEETDLNILTSAMVEVVSTANPH